MDKLKLKWKIFAFLTSFSAVLLVVLWLFQTVLLTDMYKFIRTREIEKAIILVEENVSSPNLAAVIKELETHGEIFVTPTREFVSPQMPPQRDKKKPQPEAITRVKEFTLSDGRVASLTFHAMITPVDATVSTLQMQLYIIILLMLLLSVAMAMMIAKKISKPIEDINRGAKVLANGTYDINFAAHGFLEIAELSHTLNTAAHELSRVELLRRELLANISHDLRTPLALIYSYAEMMHDFPHEVTPKQPETIMEETIRLTSLVNDMLEISQLEAGNMMLNKEQFNLTASLQKTAGHLCELLKKDGYSITFQHHDEVYITADPVKITQVFYNLLTNAIHYSGENKNIVVVQSVENGFVKIEVHDHGEGISPANLPYIWDRYYKIDKTHKRAVTGTGLGLSIVKKIIELHSGYYGVESQPNSGSTFFFILPL